VLLRVVQPSERAPLGESQLLDVEEDGRRHERTREGSPPRFVGPGYEAPLERSVEREQAPPRA
jgi:hypothetical protein